MVIFLWITLTLKSFLLTSLILPPISKCLFNKFLHFSLGKGNLSFYCIAPTNPNFCQLKIIILFFHMNNFLWPFIVLLIWALSFNWKVKQGRWHYYSELTSQTLLSFFTSMTNVFNLKWADSEIFYFANQQAGNNSPNFPYNTKLNCLCLNLKSNIFNFSEVFYRTI